jgi:membrane-associated phospholipid phosphatase
VLDRWAFDALFYPPVHEKDWGRFLRSIGSLVFWVPLATAVWLEGRARGAPRPRQAWMLVLAPIAAGLGAEILKLLLRRERPSLHAGEWVFRSFAERPFSTSALGLPSSHVMVAFGGAAVLARMFPQTAPVAYLLAAGCGLTRVLSRGHFLSDVVVGAAAGWAVGALLWHRFGRNRTPG